ncbi:MAG: ABC transporter ATP-binding protein [Marinilabiliales bacterium]|nr:MAG: ABC transporter ATP-binding protein [Marinilabiliales bacterium]
MSLEALKNAPVSKPSKIFLLFSAALTALLEMAGLAIIVPLLLLLLEDEGITGNKYLQAIYETTGIENYGFFLLIVIAIVLLLLILKNITLHKINNYKNKILLRIYSHYTHNLFFRYYCRGLPFIKNSSPTSLSHDVNAVCFQYVFGYINPALIMAGDLLLSALIIISIAYINIYIAVIQLVIFAPLIIVSHLKIGMQMQKAGKADNEAKRSQWRVTTEIFRGYADIVVNNYFQRLSNAFTQGTKVISMCKMQVERLKSMVSKSIEINVILLITGVVAGYYFFAGEDSGLRSLVGIFALATLRLLPAVRSIIVQRGNLRNNLYTADIINKQAGSGGTSITDTGTELRFNHSIELKNISFDFGPGLPIFKNLSLRINRGERVGIRGSSGSGKSTLFYLMMGLYMPHEGSVLIDGTELTPGNRDGWHKLLGYVSQDVFIMDGTLEQNISPLEVPEPELLKKSLDVAALKDLTDRLPEGVKTMIGDSGSRISGGEKQRIGIARAYYKGAEVLLMDEPTSSLDAGTEEEIIETLEKRLFDENMTIILISHSESFLSKCDRIIDFEKLEGVVAW